MTGAYVCFFTFSRSVLNLRCVININQHLHIFLHIFQRIMHYLGHYCPSSMKVYFFVVPSLVTSLTGLTSIRSNPIISHDIHCKLTATDLRSFVIRFSTHCCDLVYTLAAHLLGGHGYYATDFTQSTKVTRDRFFTNTISGF